MLKLAQTPPPGWGEAAIIYYDCETTGLEPLSSVHIVELAAAVSFDFLTMYRSTTKTTSLPSEWCSLMKPPPGTMTEGARNIHHISDDMLKDAPSFAIKAREWFQWLATWREHIAVSKLILVAHNGQWFDHPLLLQEFHTAYPGEEWPSWLHFGDTLLVLKQLPWCLTQSAHQLALKTLALTYVPMGLCPPQDHRALSDVRLLIAIVRHMRCQDFVYKWLFLYAKLETNKNSSEF